VTLSGTPYSFIREIASLGVHSGDKSFFEKVKQQTEVLTKKWGVESIKLQQEWRKLSGGENQRIILAIGMATSPRVLVRNNKLLSASHMLVVMSQPSYLLYPIPAIFEH